MKKRMLSMLLAIVMVVGLVPVTASAAESVPVQKGDFMVTTDVDGGWEYNDVEQQWRINKPGEYTVSMAAGKTITNQGIVVDSDGITLILNNVQIRHEDYQEALDVKHDVSLRIVGTVRLTGDSKNPEARSGIGSPNQENLRTVTISGDTLYVTGGSVGKNSTASSGVPGIMANVVLNGAIVIVQGGKGGDASNGDGQSGGNGIYGDVTVNAGSLTATAGDGGTGVDGKGNSGVAGINGDVTVNGGELKAIGGTGSTSPSGNREGGVGMSGQLHINMGTATAIGNDGRQAFKKTPTVETVNRKITIYAGDSEDAAGTVSAYSDQSYAKYVVTVQYPIVYKNVEDASSGTGLPEVHTKGVDTVIPNPTKARYRFDGWLVNDGTTPVKDLTLSADEYTDAITLMATWTPKQDAVVTAAPIAVTGLTYTGAAQTLVTAGTATGGTMQYSLDGRNYSADIPIGINAKGYTVWYKVVGDENHNDTEPASVNVSIAKIDAFVTADPTAFSGLTYTGESQTLVMGGTTTGGTMQYALGVDGENAPTDGWTTNIPTGKNAGAYYVWYKVDGGNNYYDVAPACVEVNIDKAYLEVTAKSYILEIGNAVPNLSAAGAYTITGLVSGEDVSVFGGKPVLSYDSTPDMSKTGWYTIKIDVAGMNNGNYDISGFDGLLEVVECAHTFTDFVLGTVTHKNDSIFAKCSKGCEEYEEPDAILTLIAPESAVYEQGLGHTAGFVCDGQIGTEVSSENIVYGPDDKLTDGYPVNAGTYTASYTYQDVTASVTYEVAKRPLTIKADNKSVYVNGTAPEYTYTVTGWEAGHDDEYGHRLSGVTVSCDGADLTKTGSYEIALSGTPVVKDEAGNDVTDNYTFIWENGTLTVSNRPSSGGSSSPGYPPAVEDSTGGDTAVSDKNPEKGDEVTITTEPDKGYEVGSVTVTDKDGEPVEVIDNGDGTFTYVQPAGKVTIEVEYVPAASGFTDVAEGSYYEDAVNWAVAEGITSGTSATTFSPDAPCTRAQMATFLWRAAGSPEPVGTSNPFTDVTEDAYYAKAVQWAVEQGITAGTSATTFSPNAPCTRAQMATFIYRCEQANGGGFTGAWMFPLPFTDAPEWAYEPIAWCYKEGITSGTSATTFSPNDPCTRTQMVTFLHRFFVK